jgi:hypothetical protein
VRVDERNLQAFEKGKTTYQEVVTRLGPPTSNTLLGDGRRMIFYNYMQAQARPENFIPLIGPFVGGADARASLVSLTFDQNGVLQTYTASESQNGMGRNLSSGVGPADRVHDQPRAQVH